MKVRHGRYGAFLGCTRYPECKGIVNIPKKGETLPPTEDLPACPAIDCPGHMVARKSRFGKIFYSCSTFPDCDVIVNQLDQLETKYPDHPRTPYQKKEKKGRGRAKKAAPAKRAKTPKKEASTKKAKTTARSMPSYSLSPDLAAVVGSSELTRGEVTKKVWEYIKAHNLQDAQNKRLIHPDALLTKVFGSKESIDMFKMAGLLNKHIKK
jgi:DNA topoisomerase-1